MKLTITIIMNGYDNFIIFRGFETMAIESFYEVRTIINKEVFRFL